jgi:hypothetical protein
MANYDHQSKDNKLLRMHIHGPLAYMTEVQPVDYSYQRLLIDLIACHQSHQMEAELTQH